MKKKIIIGIVISIFIGLIIYIFYPAKVNIKESVIKTEIEKSNYCDVDSDCVDAGGKCPFGCWVYVNKNEVDKISQLIKSFDTTCVYDCVYCPTAICTNHKCNEVCKQ